MKKWMNMGGLHQKSTSNRKGIVQLCRDVESIMNSKLSFLIRRYPQ